MSKFRVANMKARQDDLLPSQRQNRRSSGCGRGFQTSQLVGGKFLNIPPLSQMIP